jgi:hypothetical protein
MRPDCLECVRKHFNCAGSILQEMWLGYPQFLGRFDGELNNAEQECLVEDMEMAMSIRQFRLEVDRVMGLYVSGTASPEDLLKIRRELEEAFSAIYDRQWELWLAQIAEQYKSNAANQEG